MEGNVAKPAVRASGGSSSDLRAKGHKEGTFILLIMGEATAVFVATKGCSWACGAPTLLTSSYGRNELDFAAGEIFMCAVSEWELAFVLAG